MSTLNSAKYQQVQKIIESTPQVDETSTKTFRQRCIDRIIAEVGMTIHGASTYFTNKSQQLGISSTKSSTPRSTVVEQPSARDMLGEIDIDNLPINARNTQVYSMVTVDKNKIAIDVRCFNDKAYCLDMCNKLNKHFVMGCQQRGSRLNVLRSERKIEDVSPVVW